MADSNDGRNRWRDGKLHWSNYDWTVGDTTEMQDMRDRAMQSLGYKLDQRFTPTDGQKLSDGVNFKQVDRRVTDYGGRAKSTYDKSMAATQAKLNAAGPSQSGRNVPVTNFASFNQAPSIEASFGEKTSRDQLAMSEAQTGIDWKLRQDALKESLYQQQIKDKMEDDAARSKVWGDVMSAVGSTVASAAMGIATKGAGDAGLGSLVGNYFGRGFGGSQYNKPVIIDASVVGKLGKNSGEQVQETDDYIQNSRRVTANGLSQKARTSDNKFKTNVSNTLGDWYASNYDNERLG